MHSGYSHVITVSDYNKAAAIRPTEEGKSGTHYQDIPLVLLFKQNSKEIN